MDGLLALIDAGAAELLLVSAGESVVSAPPATTYANAKVLLLGDSGVGKSGLAMVLAGEEFRPTESTHGRRIWLLQTADPAADEQESSGGSREVMLWDLAGQPGYRIVHQLHLEGAAREIEAATAVLRGKTVVLRGTEDVAEYDVFLSYQWPDKDTVRSLARQLRNRGLRPWMDERQLRPGGAWQPEPEEIIARPSSGGGHRRGARSVADEGDLRVHPAGLGHHRPTGESVVGAELTVRSG